MVVVLQHLQAQRGLDLEHRRGAEHLRQLVAGADIVLEGEKPGRLAALGLDHSDLRAEHPELIWTSVTSHGRPSARSAEPWTDLTLAAAVGSGLAQRL